MFECVKMVLSVPNLKKRDRKIFTNGRYSNKHNR